MTRALPLLLAGATLLLSSYVPANAAEFRDCGQMSNHFAYNIVSRNVPCGKAHRVVRRWNRTVAQNPGGDGQVLGLYCNFRSVGHEAGVIRCSHLGRVVRWETGS